MHLLFGFLLAATAIFLILLILVQRGRGGGLTGALGGMGGQSAFGAKAGDVFTRITIVTAVVWVVLCVGAIRLIGSKSDKLSDALGGGSPVSDGAGPTKPMDDTGAKPPAESAPPGAPAEPDSGE